MPECGRNDLFAGRLARNLRQPRDVEGCVTGVGALRLHATAHQPDLFFEHELARRIAAVEARKQHRRTHRRMSGERKLASRREDAQLCTVRRIGRRKDEHGL
jgi:hypothetical protein